MTSAAMPSPNKAQSLTQPAPASPPVWRKWLVRWGLLLFILGATAWGCRASLLTWWGESLDVGQPLREPVDLVFILGGDLETRPFVAAEIYTAGFADKVLVSKPQPHSLDFLGGRTEGDLTRAVLLKLDVPEGALFDLPLTVDSTRGELESLREYVGKHDVHSLAIVSSDFHTRRVQILAERILAGSGVQIRIVSAPTDACTPANWWRSESGIGVYVQETLKLVSVFLHAA